MSIAVPLEEALLQLTKVQCMLDLKKHHFKAAQDAYARASTLIELVEIYDCGHIGGFGDGQLITNEGGAVYMDKYHHLFARFLWLYEKYVQKSILSRMDKKVLKYWKL